jgi:hypothetical protein
MSIEGLLEDEQGLSMRGLLVVKYDTPSYEFTFNVGIDLISKIMILTPLI